MRVAQGICNFLLLIRRVITSRDFGDVQFHQAGLRGSEHFAGSAQFQVPVSELLTADNLIQTFDDMC